MSGRLSKIEQHGLEARVRTAAAKGASSREIAAQLDADGFDITDRAVSRWLKAEADDRREAARGVAAADAAESVPLATRSLRRLIELCMESAERSARKNHAQALARVTTAATGAIRTLHAITVGDELGADPRDELRNEIQKIMRRKWDAGVAAHPVTCAAEATGLISEEESKRVSGEL